MFLWQLFLESFKAILYGDQTWTILTVMKAPLLSIEFLWWHVNFCLNAEYDRFPSRRRSLAQTTIILFILYQCRCNHSGDILHHVVETVSIVSSPSFHPVNSVQTPHCWGQSARTPPKHRHCTRQDTAMNAAKSAFPCSQQCGQFRKYKAN